MKLELILVSAILVVLIFLPFILVPLLRNGDLKKIAKKFREEEKKHQLITELKETWRQNYIGIDLTAKKLLFVQKSEEDFFVEVIDLKMVASCVPLIENFDVQKEGKTQNVLKRVSLEFSFKNSLEKKLINFFDYDLHFSQDLEVNHSKKWAAIVNQHLIGDVLLKRTAA